MEVEKKANTYSQKQTDVLNKIFKGKKNLN